MTEILFLLLICCNRTATPTVPSTPSTPETTTEGKSSKQTSSFLFHHAFVHSFYNFFYEHPQFLWIVDVTIGMLVCL